MVVLVERYRGLVFGLCYRILAQREDAEDMTQETFLRVFKSLNCWDSNRDFKPWLLAIAGNRCRSFLASKAKRPAPRELVQDFADPTPGLETSHHLTEEVARAVDLLREEHRQAFLLFHEQELNYAEIGAALDCPVGTVKTWIHRARRELARELSERGVIEETNKDELPRI